MNLDKRKKAYRKILREYQKFKRKLIYRSEKEVLWESCNKIHFYSSIKILTFIFIHSVLFLLNILRLCNSISAK